MGVALGPKPTQTIRKGRLAVCGLAIFALVVWIGSNRLPADATVNAAWRGVSKHKSLPGKIFRIASFNIHGGKGQDRNLDLSRVADCIRQVQPQFVGLNEVHGTCFGTRLNQADALGEKLGLASQFVPTENRFWQPSFGNGLLTDVATTPVHKLPLPCTQGRKYRTATLTSFEVGGETIKVLSVHLDRVKDREVQLQQVFSLFRDLESPAILMGDLNTTPDDPLLKPWLEDSNIHDAVGETCGASAPADRIDWIFTRGLIIRDAGLLANDASDHPLVWAELEILPDAKRESRRAE